MLAIAGGKGGCGKTTTTLGLASAIVRQRKAALVADTDREMPDLHALAGVSRDPGLDAVADGWPPEMVAGIADTPTRGVAVLPAASRQPDNARSQSDDARRWNPNPGPDNRDSSSVLAGAPSLLARLRGFAGSVLFDCPAGAGPDAVAPLRIADAVVLVTTTEPACLRDTAKTAAMARELGTPIRGAVVSRSENVPDGVPALLDCPVLGVVPDAGAGADASPLADDRVRAAHDKVVSALQPKCL